MQFPLHLDISEQLRQRIINGDYLPGTKLPSERQLIAEFQVSRITIRRAIANLVDQGLAIAHQGKGVFVIERRKAIYTLTNPGLFLADDLAHQGIELSLQNITFELVTPPATVQKILQLTTEQPWAYLQKKILLMDQIPGCVDVTYVLPDIGEALQEDLKRQMTFPTLEQHNITIERVEAIIECQNADHEMSEYLNVPLGYSLLVYRHTAYTVNDHPVVHGASISRGDRFCYSVNLRRDKKNEKN
ncbi:MAG: GntR family transcriptional regulator [Cyanothece sp. SIO1E1]|nr:GntR family transcriptional regulator [Cyanothece sp. SIO1E1]